MIFNTNVSLGKKFWDLNVSELSLHKVIADIRSLKYKGIPKKDLPYFSLSKFGSCEHKGRFYKKACLNKAFIESNALLFDVDDVVYAEEREKIMRLIGDYVLFLFKSPSGNGIKFAIRLGETVTNYKDYRLIYKSYLSWLGKKGIVCDNTCDSRRICYLSSDESVYYNVGCMAAPYWSIRVPYESVIKTSSTKSIEVLDEDIEALKRYLSGDYFKWLRFAMSLTSFENGKEILLRVADKKDVALQHWENLVENVSEISAGTFYYMLEEAKEK